MEKKEYLNEEEYQNNSKKLKGVGKTLLIIGVVLLILGLILIGLGFVGIGSNAINGIGSINQSNPINGVSNIASGAFGSMALFIIGGFINTVGFGLTIAGGITMLVAHKREIVAFSTQQVMPLAQEGIDKMAPTIGKAAGTIAKSVKDALKDDSEK